MTDSIIVRQLGRQDYTPIWQAMQDFTDHRGDNTSDELWLVEHNPVFTQGQAGKEEHLLAPGDIPVVKVDRGGQVTYHGPGQQMLYVLVDLRRRKLGVRHLVTALEQTIIETLAPFGIEAYAKADAPGVYVDEKKICSVGLRIRKGCSFHGLAMNVNMDLGPFQRINPCGYAGMEMIHSAQLEGPNSLEQAGPLLVSAFCQQLNIEHTDNREGFDE
ncbi:Lipoyl(octanoyl) transferase [Saliniradius amylolyticus]|uniref:Octanoyltransferase n=1 Tax=Saliniradius amylolyticus TaxID=2183582 RepID=A0A2S2E1Q8_9ALTE|nr:lipoyl(octanoyl) transferase LipB [Saliniradius amylolyticus]AWL11529.1 Lipoyl(octanoyl) transferase [Saliniradius amylolyticus]